MGLIKTLTSAVGGGLADQWLEVIEADDMGQGTVFTSGVAVRQGDARNRNLKGTTDVISDGSVIHVNPNQFMLLVDGGAIVDYTAEPGYFTVDNSSMPSLFNGQIGDSIKETFKRFKFAGTTPGKQKVYFINLQEIKGIKFGTPNPLNYYDNFYNAELFLRTFGNYSIKIVDPILFFKEAIPRNAAKVEIEDINEQYLSEFLEALQATMNQMSVDGIRVSHVPSKGRELSEYMSNILDESWRTKRGMEVLSVGIASISYDDESKELINMRNKGAMLGDANIREGYVQGSIARGMEAAGSNESGAGMSFMGLGVGLNATGGFMNQASNTNLQQMQMQQQQQQNQQAMQNNGTQYQQPQPPQQQSGGGVMGAAVSTPGEANDWNCPSCHADNKGKFCVECGEKKPEKPKNAHCSNCGASLKENAKFCSECGEKLQ